MDGADKRVRPRWDTGPIDYEIGGRGRETLSNRHKWFKYGIVTGIIVVTVRCAFILHGYNGLPREEGFIWKLKEPKSVARN